MSDIPLTGLAGDHPLGFLAAVGLLRCCEELDGLAGTRLSWRNEAGWRAVLHVRGCDGLEDVVSKLVERARARDERPELVWADTLQVSPELYRETAFNAESAWLAGEPSTAGFLAGYATEVAREQKAAVVPTQFHMTSGQQKFLRECRRALQSLAKGYKRRGRTKPPAALVQEALFGPWRYEDPYHSLGWDPSTERVHALRAQRPSNEESRGVVGAVCLAFEALPMFPCVPSGGRPATTGFQTFGTGRDRRTYFTWPLWDAPLGPDSVRSVLALSQLTHERPPAAALREMGVIALFRSERYRLPTQGAYYLLRPPDRLV